MKVIEDKVTVYPPHAICKADVPVILSALPAEWTAGIQRCKCVQFVAPLTDTDHTRLARLLGACLRQF